MAKHHELMAVQNKIILRQEEPESMSKGGIALADVSKKKRYCGRVVAVGPGKVVGGVSPNMTARLSLDVRVGDFVHFQDFHGGEIEHEGEKYLVIDEDDVLAVVR